MWQYSHSHVLIDYHDRLQDELLWAAAWLYHATDEQPYLDYLQNASYVGGGQSYFSWDDKFVGAQTLVAKVRMREETHVLNLIFSYILHLRNKLYVYQIIDEDTADDFVRASKKINLNWNSNFYPLRFPNSEIKMTCLILSNKNRGLWFIAKTPNLRSDGMAPTLNSQICDS